MNIKALSSRSRFLIFFIILALAAGLIMIIRQVKYNNYLKSASKPELSLESSQAIEKDQLLRTNQETISQAKEAVTEAVPAITADDEFKGSLKAVVKVIVYEDYSSRFSADFASTSARLLKEFPEQVAVAYRPYFLASSPLSRASALAAVCASKQDGFWQLRDLLFLAASKDQLAPENLESYAVKAGLDVKKFKDCLNNSKIDAGLTTSVEHARQADVFGAPTIFINGHLIPGARPWEDYTDTDGHPVDGLRSLVAKELK
jgi:protein-disulfide isomerase